VQKPDEVFNTYTIITTPRELEPFECTAINPANDCSQIHVAHFRNITRGECFHFFPDLMAQQSNTVLARVPNMTFATKPYKTCGQYLVHPA
jgi:hypothetical protein